MGEVGDGEEAGKGLGIRGEEKGVRTVKGGEVECEVRKRWRRRGREERREERVSGKRKRGNEGKCKVRGGGGKSVSGREKVEVYSDEGRKCEERKIGGRRRKCEKRKIGGRRKKCEERKTGGRRRKCEERKAGGKRGKYEETRPVCHVSVKFCDMSFSVDR